MQLIHAASLQFSSLSMPSNPPRISRTLCPRSISNRTTTRQAWFIPGAGAPTVATPTTCPAAGPRGTHRGPDTETSVFQNSANADPRARNARSNWRASRERATSCVSRTHCIKGRVDTSYPDKPTTTERLPRGLLASASTAATPRAVA